MLINPRRLLEKEMAAGSVSFPKVNIHLAICLNKGTGFYLSWLGREYNNQKTKNKHFFGIFFKIVYFTLTEIHKDSSQSRHSQRVVFVFAHKESFFCLSNKD